jgi:hypothetical protein
MAEPADRYWDYRVARWERSPAVPDAPAALAAAAMAGGSETPAQRTAVATETEADVRSG